MADYLIALAGNPNAGKSTIFNALTGARQHVGNWPGKTVEKKSGFFHYKGVAIEIVDLPGAYSLSAFSPEEVISRDFLLEAKPDLVVTVLDAANLERNLYLAVQILEMGAPVVVVLNMADVAASQGLIIDDERLSQALKAPVVRTVGRREQGIDQLVETVYQQLIRRDKGAGLSRPAEVTLERL
jgi:ferrous iron transport protein B